MDLDQFQDYARQAGKDLESLDYTKPLKASKLIIVGDIRENFAGSHSPEGAPWAPLKHREGQPLRDKGLLMAASTTALAESNDGHRLVLTNNLEYAAVHQYGHTFHKPERTRGKGEKPWVFVSKEGKAIFTRKIKEHDVTVPARPYMGISDGAADRIGLVFGEYVLGVL